MRVFEKNIGVFESGLCLSVTDCELGKILRID